MTDPRPIRFFLADPGKHYGMDLTDARLYAAPGSREEGYLSGTRSGDLFFCLSEQGISAVCIAVGEAYRSPAPAWRYRNATPGERGLSLKVTTVLIRDPAKKEEFAGILPDLPRAGAGDAGIRLIPLGAKAAHAVIDRLFPHGAGTDDRTFPGGKDLLAK